MDWIRACHKKKHTFRRGPRFIVFQGMRCALFWIPHKPEHLRINTSPSTKSSLVGLYSFQGNLQSGGERRSTEKESKTKCRKTWKWFDCYVLPFALQMKTVLLLNTMWHPHYRCSYFILHRSCCLMLWVFIRLCKEKLHFYHPELSQMCPRNSNLDDWLSWRQNPKSLPGEVVKLSGYVSKWTCLSLFRQATWCNHSFGYPACTSAVFYIPVKDQNDLFLAKLWSYSSSSFVWLNWVTLSSSRKNGRMNVIWTQLNGIPWHHYGLVANATSAG